MKIVGSTLLKVSRAGQNIIICVFDKLKEGAPSSYQILEQLHLLLKKLTL